MLTTNLQLTTLHKAFRCNILFHTHHNKMVLLRERIDIKEMANCMIQSKGLSPHFWAKAINCANYIVNR
jgi:hypothetical protein